MLSQHSAPTPPLSGPLAGALPLPVVPPDPATAFAASARRCETLAQRHPQGDWLRHQGALAGAQHEALQAFPAVSLHAGIRARASRHGMPPLAAHNWPRDPAWRHVLASLLDVALAGLPAAQRPLVEALRHAPVARLEALANCVLRSEYAGADAPAMPVLGAALQVYWTHMAAALGSAGIVPLDVPGVCPCCGFLPVAAVVRAGGELGPARYLHCALCNTEWSFTRVRCAACEGKDDIGYRRIEGGSGGVCAETCENCRSYIKIVSQDKERDADPAADDLASLALDMQMERAGYTRAGHNLLLAPAA